MKTTRAVLRAWPGIIPCILAGSIISWASQTALGAENDPPSNNEEQSSANEPLTLEQARQLCVRGEYLKCIAAASHAIQEGEYEEDWRLLLIESQMALGAYQDAYLTLSNALKRFSTSIRLRMAARDVYRFNGDPDRADTMLTQINYLGGSRLWAYRDAPNLVALGRAAVLLGADPRRVLEQFYDRAKERDRDLRDVYLASGELALDKNDYLLASQVYQEGLQRLPDDPDLHFGLARAFAPSDRLQMLASLEATLNINSNHVPSQLLLADHMIDGEAYEDAQEALEIVLEVNPHHPKAWAYRAVMAHLRVEPEKEKDHRLRALRYYTNNPAVDHLIGLKLSQKYRFKEGAEYQRQALAFDRDYLPARLQLAQDLLRLGEEEEGWSLVEQVYRADKYDVTAFNLVTLQDNMQSFSVLTNRDFILRMGSHESEIYGQEALTLLQEAKDTLCRKYDHELSRPTVVEIFPDQKDFGVRTFGMPSNPGFLGVCFGPVITANSPGSQGSHPNNWEAVLWHEFCHVVTLSITKNKMPRWLSEGISVYEERQKNPAWGQIMNPRYREMIMDGETTPLGELSAAFLAPRSDLHLQFAYYESYLAVEFLIGRFGQDALIAILRDLGEGVEINDAISNRAAPIDTLEPEFEEFVMNKAEELGPTLDWSRPEEDELRQLQPEFVTRNEDNYYTLMERGRRLLEEEQWEQAKVPLQKLLDAYPDQIGPGNAHVLLAEAHRQLNETDLERTVLTRWVLQDPDAIDGHLRLVEIGEAEEDWESVAKNARRFLAVNPLIARPHRALAKAAESLNKPDVAIAHYRKLLLLDAHDPAHVHFRLATLLFETGKSGARRHVLQALEEAPRFRAAHRLLLEMQRKENAAPSNDDT